MKMVKIVAIVPAAGSGIRLGHKISKPYIQINNHPLLSYSLRLLQKSPKINEIIVVVEKGKTAQAKKLIKRYKINKVKKIVLGGPTRSESVKNGLKVVEPGTDFVLIHDGARPFLTKSILDRCLKEVIKHKAVICAVKCSSTIKSADRNLYVTSTLDRNSLWEVQTPQVFSYDLIMRAYEKVQNKSKNFFDDASLVEKLSGGKRVKIVEGTRTNIKITTTDDLKIAKALLKTAFSV
ncbi:MAG: 2-C-methyl-D-erythritol 4-phosphate cytidylyltransferase [Candidatus Omnitrophota bacterium]